MLKHEEAVASPIPTRAGLEHWKRREGNGKGEER